MAMPHEITDLGAVRRRYGVEAEFFPLLEEFGPAQLREALIECGVKPLQAGSIVWFLEDQVNLNRRQNERTRWQYRQILKDLTPDQVRSAIQPIGGLFNSADLEHELVAA
jgi:hypothetical protein